MMTMHLVGPYLSLNGKKKGKTKFRNAEQARHARELDSSWKELLKRQGVEQEERRRYNALKAPPLAGNYSLTIPEGRSTRHIPSRDTGGNATLAPAKVYTGNEMIGIGQLHKSNAIPIFKKSDAEDLAKMRR
jgi:hypothetical protein